MKRLFTLMMCAVSFGVMGQSTIAYNWQYSTEGWVSASENLLVCNLIEQPEAMAMRAFNTTPVMRSGTLSESLGIDAGDYDRVQITLKNPTSSGNPNARLFAYGPESNAFMCHWNVPVDTSMTEFQTYTLDLTSAPNAGSGSFAGEVGRFGWRGPWGVANGDTVYWKSMVIYNSLGCTNADACNYEPLAETDNGMCILVGDSCDDGENLTENDTISDMCECTGSPIEVPGCTDEMACNFSPSAITDDGSCLELDECGICGGSGIAEGYCDCDGNVLDAVDVCGGSCLEDDDNNGVCDDQEVYGCSYPLAENFSSSVTRDDGSCIFPCEGVVNTNVFDWDGDYVVTVTDFLMMLSVYGDTDVDLDGVWDSGDDCVDTNACNYANDPSEPCTYIDILGVCGGGCEADEDNDGICDDIDACIGIEDECGVCNGPGPTEVVIEDITILYDSVFLPLDNDWYVFPISADTTFSYECAPFFGDCGDPVSYQGYDYATVLIGEQCWFAENLRSESYENGDAIPSGLSDSDWGNTSSGAVAVYGEGSSFCTNDSPDGDACDEAWSLSEYGRLYNWHAVDDVRGLCPSGWHVPTDGEWMTLEMALGMSESDANGWGWRGTDQGTQMKTDYGWSDGGNGTNSSGFSGLPGGFRNIYGDFYLAGDDGYWWSSSPSGSFAWLRYLNPSSESVSRGSNYQRGGFSVRCVRDAE